MDEYLNYQKNKGISLSDIYSGSNEYAISVENILEGLNILFKQHKPILGGDVFVENAEGNLVYAIHELGYEYIYLNWSCDRLKDESLPDYLNRSSQAAKEAIKKGKAVGEKLGKLMYFVLVV